MKKIQIILLLIVSINLPIFSAVITITNHDCSDIEVCPMRAGKSETWTKIAKGTSKDFNTLDKPLLALRWRFPGLINGEPVTSKSYVVRIYKQHPGILEATTIGRFTIYADGEYKCNFGTGHDYAINKADKDTNRLIINDDGKLYYR